VHEGERIDSLHESTKPNLACKVPRRDDDYGENDRHLRVTKRKAAEAPLAFHYLPKILEYTPEALLEYTELDRFAAVQSNTLRVLPETHEAEPEIGLESLAGKIQWHQWLTDFDGKPGTDAGVEQRCPD
jgi:hypothetical protein